MGFDRPAGGVRRQAGPVAGPSDTAQRLHLEPQLRLPASGHPLLDHHDGRHCPLLPGLPLGRDGGPSGRWRRTGRYRRVRFLRPDVAGTVAGGDGGAGAEPRPLHSADGAAAAADEGATPASRALGSSRSVDVRAVRLDTVDHHHTAADRCGGLLRCPARALRRLWIIHAGLRWGCPGRCVHIRLVWSLLHAGCEVHASLPAAGLLSGVASGGYRVCLRL